MAIEHHMQQGAYSTADSLLRRAIPVFSADDSDQLLFLCTWAQALTATARYREAIGCLQFCQTHFEETLTKIPHARAFLIECYADIATEFQLTELRREAATALEYAFSLLDSTSDRRTGVARKIAVLHRITKNVPAARPWYTIAWHSMNASCADSLRLLNEEAIQACKDCAPDVCQAKLLQGAAILSRCKTCRQEDIILHKIALADYYKLSSKLAASPFEDKAQGQRTLQELVAIGDAHPEVLSGHLYNGISSLAGFSREFGNMDSALILSKRALDGHLRRGVAPKLITNAYMDLAESCHYLGRLDEALQYYHLAIQHYPHDIPTENDQSKYIDLLHNYGQELISNEVFAEGENWMQEAIDELRAFDAGDTARLAIFYLNLAVSYEMQDCAPEAAAAFMLAALHPEGVANYRHVPAQARIGTATQLLKMGELQAANEQLDRGIQAIDRLPAQVPLSQVFPLLDLANYYRLAGDLDAALLANHRLLRAVLFDFKGANMYDCPDLQNYLTPWYTLEAVNQKMNILWAIYQQTDDLDLLRSIVACGQKALILLRKLRQERNHEGAKLKLNEKWRKLYENTLRAAMELYKKTHDRSHLYTAFEIAELSKAMMLMEAIVENQVLEHTSGSADIVSERRAIQGRMNLLRGEIATGNANAAQQEELLALQVQLDSLLDQVQKANPKYFGLVYGFDVVKIPRLQEVLRQDNRALVEFFYGENIVYTLVVNPDTMVVREYKPDQTFTKALEALTHQLHDKPDAGDNAAALAYAQRSQVVTAALWTPIAPLLRERITLIPDGPLSYISFEALVDGMPDKANPKFQDFTYLLERYTIAYHYSATFHCAPDTKLPDAQTGILGMAPDFVQHPALPPLPGAIAGIQGLGQRFADVDVRTGRAASKQAFMQNAPSKMVIDLATHGTFDRKNFLDSRIYFSPDGSGDSLLYLRELYNMDLPAELAILEACETGLGDYRQGEGVMSLARGFTYAGCQSILMSLWQVPEGGSTQQIIQGFYDRLAEGQPRDEAITASKRAYLEAMRAEGGIALGQVHPFYWSELVLIGQQGPIFLQQRQASSTWGQAAAVIAGAMLVALLAWLWWRKRGKLQ